MPMSPRDQECGCEFDPDPDSTDEATPETAWHYERTCTNCGKVVWSLHCWHERPIIRCGCPDPHDVVDLVLEIQE